jgi:hypothetical protein
MSKSIPLTPEMFDSDGERQRRIAEARYILNSNLGDVVACGSLEYVLEIAAEELRCGASVEISRGTPERERELAECGGISVEPSPTNAKLCEHGGPLASENKGGVNPP